MTPMVGSSDLSPSAYRTMIARGDGVRWEGMVEGKEGWAGSGNDKGLHEGIARSVNVCVCVCVQCIG